MRFVVWIGLVVILNGLLGWLMNLPKTAGENVPDGKLNSLSYGPYREGQSPLEEIFPSEQQIEEDIRLLAQKTHTIRIYASGEAMHFIPPLARKYQLDMIQGAWIGFLDSDSQQEIDKLVQVANAYPDVIKRVIVGNEVLLRGEMEPEKLVGFIRAVKRRVKQPVSYADVWSMYMKYPELIKEVDFITIHILPYWEDEPISVENAPAHIERIYRQVLREAEAIAPGKPILIGESGWPSVGKQRGWAEPGVVNEARFIRGLLEVAKANQFDTNIVEAFNQPWKSELEGVVGANWGLFSADRNEVFPLTGNVYENPAWHYEFIGAGLLLIMAALVFQNRLRPLPLLGFLLWLVWAQLMADIFLNQLHYAWYTSYSHWQRLQTIGVGIFNAVLAVLFLQRACDLLTGRTTQTLIAKTTWFLYMTICVIAIIITYRLAVNGRYIDYPFSLADMGVIGIAGLAVIRAAFNRDYGRVSLDLAGLIGYQPAKNTWNKGVGWVIVFMTVALIIGEIYAFMVGRDFILAYPDYAHRLYWAIVFTVTNKHLLLWLTCLILLAVPLLSVKRKIGLSK